MQFTLDSVEHAVATLKARFRTDRISYEPFYTRDLSDLHVENVPPNTFFFGVLTNGGHYYVGLMNRFDQSESMQLFITIDPNTQIIELLSGIKYDVDKDNVLYSTENPNLENDLGHFRGFQISIQ